MGNLQVDCCAMRDKDEEENGSSRGVAPFSLTRSRSSIKTPRQAAAVRNLAQTPIDDVYKVKWPEGESANSLGKGAFGSVYQARHIATGAPRAIKRIDKEKLKGIGKEDLFEHEIEIMKLLDHPHIIKLYEIIEDNKYKYLSMELCLGGDLFERIIKGVNDPAHQITETGAASITRQMLRSVWYMHDRGMIHRDLKPENFLFESTDSLEGLKLIDFGCSRRFDPDVALTTRIGTPLYIAPEVFKGKYNSPSDLWSAGVVTYIMLTGIPPFNGNNDREIKRSVLSGQLSFSDEQWLTISRDAKDIIKNLLTKDVKKRFTAANALKHVWIKDKAPNAHSEVLSYSRVCDSLKRFRTQSVFKKAVLCDIAHRSTSIGSLSQIFEQLDENGDGSLTAEEITAGLQKAGLQTMDTAFRKSLDAADVNGSGTIDYTEFLAATLDQNQFSKEDARYAFGLFDQDGDGFITPQEIREVLNKEEQWISEDMMKDILLEYDTNGDGTIDFNEFLVMLQGDPEETE